MRETGPVFGQGGASSSLSRPSSSGEVTPSRPGSSSRGSGSNCKHSMMRLPDEAPGAALNKEQHRCGQSVVSGTNVVTTMGRPTSAHRRQAGMVSPTVNPNGNTSRPGSGGHVRKASLSRLPDDPALNAPQPIVQPPCFQNPNTAEQPTAPSHRVKLRERLSKNLTVTTTTMTPAPTKTHPKVFRLLKEGEAISDLYEFAEEIYSGGAKGKVMIAKRRSDNTEVVVKIRMKHPNRSTERTWRTIMSQLHGMGGSDHILDIIEIIESSTEFYVVMPKCNGGELFEFLATETEVPEAECKRIIREILVAVGHLHKNNLIHRDIKPENIMFDLGCPLSASPKTVKLIDFDTCFEWSPQTPKSRRFVGTPGYIAPEALMGQISPQSDLWSIGVILYILMRGEMPWSSLVSLEDGIVGSTDATRMYNTLKAEVLEWDQEPWPDFPLARDLCQQLLAFKTAERLSTVEEALSHPWLKGI